MWVRSSLAIECGVVAAVTVPIALSGIACAKKRETETVRVAAAADLARAFEEMGAAFEKRTQRKVVFSFGSTGLLAKQISEGAPFDVFAAANVSFVDEVVQSQACEPETKALYAKGRIVMWTRSGPAPKALGELAEPRFTRIAMAHPEHAPYGRAAKEALTRAGLWPALESRVVYGENVQQAMQYAQSGNADVAIVALSLATTASGAFTLIEADGHDPLEQALVLCRGGGSPTRGKGFADFVNSPSGREIMRRYGFVLPGETTPYP